MNEENEKIIVRKEYVHEDYRRHLWRSFKFEYDNIKPKRGRQPFVEEVIWWYLDGREQDIVLDTGDQNYRFNKFSHNAGCRDITRYLATEETPAAEALFLREIDAFLQIKNSQFSTNFSDRHDANKIGLLLGTYLRDPVLADDRFRLSAKGQSIFGIYKYDDVDTHNVSHNRSRIVALLTGDNIDYLNVLDFAFYPTQKSSRNLDQKFDVLRGFCIPGDQLSLVVLKTVKNKERQFGLIYTPGNLVDLSGGILDELIYEVFTTNLDQQGDKTEPGKQDEDPLLARILNIHYGPRLRKELILATPEEKSEAEAIISKLLKYMI